MTTIAGFPACRLLLDKKASPLDAAAPGDLARCVRDEQLTDLLVLAHGWNNDMAEAQALYEELLGNVASLKSGRAETAQRRFGVLAVFWPSKKFADEALIPGGAASLSSADQAVVVGMLTALKGVFDSPDADQRLEEAKSLVARLDGDPDARRRFADLVRGVTPRAASDDVDESDRFFAEDGSDLLERLGATGEDDPTAPVAGVGGATRVRVIDRTSAVEGAQGLGDFFGGVVSGARNTLNFVTYYQMKERAGLVGERGVNPVVSGVRRDFPNLKVHLVGHSFGGRVVAATAHARSAGVDTVCHTLTLLQAAFSHFALSSDWDGAGRRGLFHDLVSAPRVSGPITVTCTKNDKAVGIAYAIASRVAGQVASALGDRTDKFGGIGRNGALRTAGSVDRRMLEVGEAYPPFTGNKVFNLQADAFIHDHGDVRNRRVAHALLSTIAAV